MLGTKVKKKMETENSVEVIGTLNEGLSAQTDFMTLKFSI